MRVWFSLIVMLLPSQCLAATIPANSPSRVDLSNAVALASNGDIILVTNGTGTFIDKLTVNKGVTFQVEGTNCIIVDSLPDSGGAAPQFLEIYTPLGTITKFDRFVFKDGAVDTRGFNGAIQIYGTNSPNSKGITIFTNCSFLDIDNQCLFWLGGWGQVESNYFRLKDGTFIASYLYADAVSGVSTMSDFLWATNTPGLRRQGLGVNHKRNKFDRGAATVNYAAFDAYYGAVYSVESNTLIKCWVEAHGSDSGGRRRGTRWVEVFGNTFVSNTFIANFRSASGMIYDNTNYGYSAYTTLPVLALDAYRRFYTFAPWGQTDGTNAWDVNDAGNPYDSATATAGSGSRVFIDSSKSWTVNQWTGYQLTRTNNLGVYNSSTVLTNGPTLIWVSSAEGFGTDISYSTGDKAVIMKITEAFDQPGRSGGTQLTGDPPSNGRPNDQIDDPLYEWNNVGEAGVDIDFTSAALFIREGEHYFNDTVFNAPVGQRYGIKGGRRGFGR